MGQIGDDKDKCQGREGRGGKREREREESKKREGMTATRKDEYRVKQGVVRAHRSWQVGPLGNFSVYRSIF